ncbi:MAG TPA: hypothetical protein VLI93_17370 [Acetobacteraceae bacterium]|nr:hypothetical protein [Acetobacteraceae bacterium]
MFSSISSSERQGRSGGTWRRFFVAAAGAAFVCVAVIYAFVVLVDPFDILPLSPAAERWPVATDARFSFPALARAARFDSAVFGTSTSRLLRPAVLDPEFSARFANLSMNDATVFEQSSLMDVFRRAHPAPRVVAVGLDVRWCVTGDTYQKLTPRPFPEWMYQGNPAAGYRHMLNLYAVQEAGQQFGILIGVKRPVYGRDGFTRFVPPDSDYDPARAAAHLREAGPLIPPGLRSGPASTWRYPALETLQAEFRKFPAATRKVAFFVPYNHRLFPPPGTAGAQVWDECKRRVAAMATDIPNMVAVDFMRPSPITDSDDNYWDSLHYRMSIADRLATELAATVDGVQTSDGRLLGGADSAGLSQVMER